MRIPATQAEFLAPLVETIDELEALALCAEQDLDDETADLNTTFRAVAQPLRELGGQIDSGAGVATDAGDLACMRLARTCRPVIPFFPLLDSLNRMYQQGFGCR